MSSFQAAGRDLGILTDPKEEERTTLSRSIRSIGYKKDYLEDTWFPPQAFREFIQNLLVTPSFTSRHYCNGNFYLVRTASSCPIT
jgi:hypothetical protein